MYRFSDIIGHDEVKTHFKAAIQMNKVSHAYMIEGEVGSGKKLLADTFAKVLECQGHGDEACDTCQSCILFNSGNHPDIIHIKATKKTGLGVDDIREQINQDVHIRPYVFDYKVYILHEADGMTVQAQNALLKTLEEPPSYVRFLLLATHTQGFLPTILSRCVVIKLRPVSEAKITAYLQEKMNVPDYQAGVYASFSRGNIGKALSLKDSEAFKEMRGDMIRVMEALSTKDKIKVMDQVTVFEKYKEEKDIFLDLCLTWLRDLMMVKSLKEGPKVIHLDMHNQMLKQAPHLSYNRISMLINGIERILRYDRLHINYTLLVEVMLIDGMNVD